jgi:PCFT/HCP family folate transporter-like MFS transporter 1/3
MPMTFAGGWPLLDIAFCCYVADLSSDETRSFRIGLIGFLNIMGNVSAYFSSSFILGATNLTTVFLIAFVVCLIGFLWMIFFIDETVMPPENMSLIYQIKEITSKERMQEIVVTFRKYREKNGRKILWFLVLIPSLVVSTMHGVATLNYLYVREKFGWTLREWTIFESSNTFISALGLFIGLMVFKKVMKISDMKLAMFGLTLSVIDSTFKALATRAFHLYLSSGITLFRLLSMPMLRSIVSVVVAHDEIGKVYSLTTCFEALSGLGAGPLYNAVYQNSFTTFPGAFYLLTAGIFAINLILTIFVSRWISRGKFSN